MWRGIFLLVIAFSCGVFAQAFRIDYEQNIEHVLNEKEYVYFSHSTSFWDEKKTSENGTRALLQFAKNNRITSIAAVHKAATQSDDVANQYYIKNNEVDFVVLSDAGQHKLQFPQAKSIYVSGGNLTLCLCEAIRDFARGTSQTSELDLVIVKDAVYDIDTKVNTFSEIRSYIKKYLLPNFNCPLQNWFSFPGQALPDLKIRSYSEERFAGEYNVANKNGDITSELIRTINLRFISSDRLRMFP